MEGVRALGTLAPRPPWAGRRQPRPSRAARRPARPVVVAVISACALLAAGARATPASAGTVPIGAHSMLQLNSPHSFMEAMFSEAAGMHASAIRLDVAPSLVFTSPSGAPDFAGLDEVMALAQQYHLRVVADLFTVPSWIANCQTGAAPLAAVRCGTDDLTDYGAEISQIVQHADPVIHDWEIWNEPDTSAFFTGTPQQYARMLRTAHDVIKQIDPGDSVLLGGISSPTGMSWLGQVFATPGADAAHAFDVANVHVRGALVSLASAITSWKWFLALDGFSGPLWVTEHGYPSDPAFQYDSAYAAGQASQAAFLTASIPTLIDAGAGEVFVTERDDLGGEFASEGLLGGSVADPPVADPQVIQKPAYAAVRATASCYQLLGRDCVGAPPAVSPGWLVLRGTRVGSSRTAAITVSDPGIVPVELAPAALAAGGSPGIAIQHDDCPGILEPAQTCTVQVRFRPGKVGPEAATLQLTTDVGTVRVAVSAVSPSVSALTSPDPDTLAFGGPDGVGDKQHLVLSFANRLLAPVRIAGAKLSGTDAGQFWITRDRCRGSELGIGRRCRLTVLFGPSRAGTRRAKLMLRGDGRPLKLPLVATAYGPPTVVSLPASGSIKCTERSANPLVVQTDQRSRIVWRAVLARRARDPSCRGASAAGATGRSSASGRSSTGIRPRLTRGQTRYVARLRIPLAPSRLGLRAGVYRLTVAATNTHGTGRTRTIWLTVSA
jgi:hypothetical protein